MAEYLGPPLCLAAKVWFGNFFHASYAHPMHMNHSSRRIPKTMFFSPGTTFRAAWTPAKSDSAPWDIYYYILSRAGAGFL